MSALVQTALLVNATTGSGAKTLHNRTKSVGVTVEWGPGTSAGVVQIEVAPHKDYAGTWSSLTSFTWTSAANYVDSFRGSVPGGMAIRARISTTVTTSDDGVTVVLDEN